MKKRIFFTLLGLIAVIALLGGIKASQIGVLIAAGENFSEPPLTVNASEVTTQVWEAQIHTVGAFQAIEGVTVAADLAGLVRAIRFQPGTQVEAGTVLVEQDISSEQAQLHQAEAAIVLAEQELKRSRELLNSRAGSQAAFDAADATLKQARAQAEAITATIEKKTIRAPFSGRLGIRQVNLGQALREGDPVVSLQTLDPIYLNFLLPQRHFNRLQDGLTVLAYTDAVTDNGAVTPLTGTLTAINPEVDSSTRNLAVQATFANTDGRVLPGMSAAVSVVLPQPDTVLAIPSTAVLNAAYGDSVYVIESNNGAMTARQQFVRLGRTQGDFVEVQSGLEAGQQVVSTGVFKLRNGQPVSIDNALQPDFQQDPQPENR